MTPPLTLYLIRGLPGSGKSTLAETLAPEAHFSADLFFEQMGEYQYKPFQRHQAHGWCMDQVAKAMANRTPAIAVSNVFPKRWMLRVYEEMALVFGYSVFVVSCENNYGNVHGCPQEAIDKMKEGWET